MSEFEKRYKFICVAEKLIMMFSRRTQMKMLDKCRYTKGKIGIGLRYILVRTLATECGENVVIMEGVYLKHIERMTFGSNVSINPMAYLDASVSHNKGIRIGNNVSIAHGVTIMASTHNYLSTKIPIKAQGGEDKLTTICDDVWIGAKATILAGVTIRKGCVIGANAVVTKDTPEYSVCVGIPATMIKKRSPL